MSNSICVINEQEVFGKQFRVLEPSKDCLVGDFQANTSYTFLTEDGLYEVLMLSRKPIAKQFKSKVKEVLKQEDEQFCLF